MIYRVLSKEQIVNRYGDPWNPTRLTDEITVSVGALVRRIAPVAARNEAERWCLDWYDGETWIHGRCWERPRVHEHEAATVAEIAPYLSKRALEAIAIVHGRDLAPAEALAELRRELADMRAERERAIAHNPGGYIATNGAFFSLETALEGAIVQLNSTHVPD